MRLAIVTGGSRGLGAALCELYSERGWHVLEFSRSAPHPYSVRLDLSDPQTTDRIIAESLASLEPANVSEVVAIGNAGVLGPVGPVTHSPPADLCANLDVNVLSAILFARRVVGSFQRHRCEKTFVNITSGAAVRAHAGWSLYCAGKAALEHYMRAVALEQTRYDHPFRAYSVNPGVMDTAMQAEVRDASDDDVPGLQRYRRLHTEGRLAAPADVAARIAAIVDSRPRPGEVYAASP